jgi:hypothetical protein
MTIALEDTPTTSRGSNYRPGYVVVEAGETILEAVARWHKTHGRYFRQDRIDAPVAA